MATSSEEIEALKQRVKVLDDRLKVTPGVAVKLTAPEITLTATASVKVQASMTGLDGPNVHALALAEPSGEPPPARL